MYPNRYKGFTLLEALVTIVIVSIGLLGLLGLQTVSLVNTQVSAARTQATFAANDIANRMRANAAGVADNAYDGVDHPSAGELSKSCLQGNACTSTQMAAFDAWQWDHAIGERLPNGEGALDCIETDGGSCVRYRVTVRWNERERDTSGQGNDTVARSFETVIRP